MSQKKNDNFPLHYYMYSRSASPYLDSSNMEFRMNITPSPLPLPPVLIELSSLRNIKDKDYDEFGKNAYNIYIDRYYSDVKERYECKNMNDWYCMPLDVQVTWNKISKNIIEDYLSKLKIQ